MDAKEIGALADTLAAGRKSKKPMDVAGLMANLSEADAYKVQFAVHDRFGAEGDPIAGWKVALTLPVQYEPLKLSGPVFAASTRAVCARAARRSRRAGRSSPASSPSWWRASPRMRRPVPRRTRPTASAPMSPISIAAWKWW